MKRYTLFTLIQLLICSGIWANDKTLSGTLPNENMFNVEASRASYQKNVNITYTIAADGTEKVTWDAIGNSTIYGIYWQQVEDASGKRYTHYNLYNFPTASHSDMTDYYATRTYRSYTDKWDASDLNTSWKVQVVGYRETSANEYTLVGFTALSDEVKYTGKEPETPPPGQPSGFTASSVTSQQIKLKWNALSGVSKYRLLFRAVDADTDDDNDWKQLGEPTSTSATLTCDPGDWGKLYDFAVAGINSQGTIGLYSILWGVTIPNPGKVEGLTIPVNALTAFKVQWNSFAGADGYQLEGRQSGSIDWNTVHVNTNCFEQKDVTRSPGQVWEFRVKAKSGDKFISHYSDIITNTTPVPDAPNVTSVSSIDPFSAKIVWNKVEGASKYKIFRRVWGENDNPMNGVISYIDVANTEISYTDRNVSAGKYYQYCVEASFEGTLTTTGYGASKILFFQPIQITSYNPSADADFINGMNSSISWTGIKGYSDLVIEFIQNGIPAWDIVVPKNSDMGSYSFTVPSTFDLPPGKYTLCVRFADAPTIKDERTVRVGSRDDVELTNTQITSNTYYAYDEMKLESITVGSDVTAVFIAPTVILGNGTYIEYGSNVRISAGEYGDIPAPGNLKITPTTENYKEVFKLSWTYPDNIAIKSYEVFMSIDGKAEELITRVPGKSATIRLENYRIDGYVEFRVRVHSESENKKSVRSAPIVLRPNTITLAVDADITSAEGVVDHALKHNAVRLKYTGGECASSYTVQRRNLTDPQYQGLIPFTTVPVTFSENGTFVDNSVDFNRGYQYKIIANGISFKSGTPYRTRESVIINVHTPPKDLSCDIKYDKCQYTWKSGEEVDNHWIPNTVSLSEHCRVAGFEIFIKSQVGNTLTPINEGFKNIRILPPLDPNWASNLANGVNADNIKRNQGNWPLELWAYNKALNKSQWLVTFTKNANPTGANDVYQITRVNSSYFDANQNLKEGNLLATNSITGQLYFKTGSTTYHEFALQFAQNPQDDNAVIRPGDDFLLRFTTADYSGVETVAKANDGDFFAAYDHKMLWRANLYIDEGAQDFNNLYPWRTGNEWNKIYDGRSLLRGFARTEKRPNLGNLASGNGGQVVSIREFTRRKTAGVSDGGKITGTVAYSLGCHDSPFEYNNDMFNQEKVLEYCNNNNISHTYIDPINNGNVTTNYREYLSLAHTSFAPSNNPEDPLDESSDYKRYYHPTPLNGLPGEVVDLSSNLFNYDGGQYFPYLPGWSVHKQDVPYWVNAISAGVDCIGFAQTSASYSGNRYKWDNLDWNHNPHNSLTWDNEFPSSSVEADPTKRQDRLFPHPTVHYDDTWSWEIASPDEPDDPNDNTDDDDIGMIVPGDIMYYTGHIVMVLSVEYDNNARTTSNGRIKFVEATYGWNRPKPDGTNERIAEVINDFSLHTYRNKNWRFVRLQTAEGAK